MQIRMKSGRTVHYRAGEVYSDDRVSRHDRDHFVNNGFAERVEAKAIAAAPENKMLNDAPENKGTPKPGMPPPAGNARKGVCPKCGKHVGRGVSLHSKKCRGS